MGERQDCVEMEECVPQQLPNSGDSLQGQRLCGSSRDGHVCSELGAKAIGRLGAKPVLDDGPWASRPQCWLVTQKDLETVSWCWCI